MTEGVSAVDVSLDDAGGRGGGSSDRDGIASEAWAARLGGSVELVVPGAADVTADASVLHAAIERGYSADGELFDVHHLALLAGEVCGLHATVVVLSEQLQPSNASAASLSLARGLAAWLEAGGLAIFPYDSDGSHRPALKGGHSAHYALVCGAALARGRRRAADNGEADIRIVCMHGLSRRPLVVSSAELAASNAQLHEMKSTATTKKWVVGQAGVRLSHRVVLLR